MKVTEVLPQKNNSHRFNVFLDGVFAFGADEDLVVEYRLIPGKVIEESLLTELFFEAEVGKLMERMYYLFGIRQRSEKEVRDYLRNLSFKRKLKDKEELSPLVVDRLVEKLTQKGMLNDLQFANNWVESRSKKRGINLVKAELFKKGLGRELIEEVISENQKVGSQEQTAEDVLLKRLPRWSKLPYQETRKKAYEFLLRRGFEYEVVKDVVERTLKK